MEGAAGGTVHHLWSKANAMNNVANLQAKSCIPELPLMWGRETQRAGSHVYMCTCVQKYTCVEEWRRITTL